TRAPIRGGDLRGVDLVLASHKHSDHLDPGTLPDLLAASPRAVLVLPEAIREYARGLGLPAERLVGLDAGGAPAAVAARWAGVSGPRPRAVRRSPGGTFERAGFRVRALPSAHEGLDTDEAGHHLYLGYVVESEGLRLYHSGDSLAYDRLADRLAVDRF